MLKHVNEPPPPIRKINPRISEATERVEATLHQRLMELARAVREYEKLRDAIQGDSQSEAA